MVDTRSPHRHLDVVCELDGADAGARLDEWARLCRDDGLRRESIAGGARLWLRADAVATAQDLIQRESQCCGFLDFELVADGPSLRLDITSPNPAAEGVIASLLGLS